MVETLAHVAEIAARQKVIQIDLINQGWATSGRTQARGYAHLGNRFLRPDGLAGVLEGCRSEAEWREVVSRLNGCFAAVSQLDGKVLAAVDRIRSIPLFYSSQAGKFFLSDSAPRVLDQLGRRELNADSNTEFRLTGYVTGRETLYSGVYQIEAGHLVVFESSDSSGLKQHRHFRFEHRDFFRSETTDLVVQLDAVHRNIFRRLVDSVERRTIVLPLSGGYDSRLIAVSLRDMGFRNVICYTYGVPGNWESRVSQELARYLGFAWEFVPYSVDRWQVWAGSEKFHAYFQAAGNLTSVPHIQDWPAVLELHKDHRIPTESVFVPGHTGDFLTGGHIPKWYIKRAVIRPNDFFDSIRRTHYALWDWPEGQRRELSERIRERIEAVIGPVSDVSPEAAADLYERWELQERQAKFICNSVRVYENFGYEWRLPLYDSELMDFWSRVPIQGRTARRLYREFVKQRQTLPVAGANRDDYSALGRWILKGIEVTGLRAVAKHAQRVSKRILWRREYEKSILAWYAIVDRQLFRSTYTGKQTLYSYLTARYLAWVAKTYPQH